MIRILILISALCLAPITGPAIASAQSDQDDALRAVRSGQIMSYGQIRKMTERALGGTVIGQNPPRRVGKRWVYNLRVLQKNGQVVQVAVDAKNGRVLRKRGGS